MVGNDLKKDEFVFTMVQFIKEQFENEHEMFDWIKDIFQWVTDPKLNENTEFEVIKTPRNDEIIPIGKPNTVLVIPPHQKKDVN